MKKIILLLSALILSVNAFSQNKIVLTEGTRYMVAFPQVQASPSEKPLPQPMLLLISSKSKGKVRVQTPAVLNDNSRIDREYSIEPNKTLKIAIPIGYMNQVSQTKSGYGILVSSTKPISVSTYQAWQGNGELARHIPIESWGKTYYSMNMYQDRYGTSGAGYKYRPSQILIIASKDNTVVTYTPSWETEGGNDMPGARKGESQTITLEKGETYLIRGKIDENYNKEWVTDLSGTLIRSNKPVGIISGHVKVAILRYPDELPPTGMYRAEAHFIRNNVHDCMLPIEMAGTKFVTIPSMYTPLRNQGAGASGAEIGIEDDRGDVVRFIALEDGTLISSMRQAGDGLKSERLLRRGESFLATTLTETTYWETSKPVLASQYGKSYAKVLPPIIKKPNEGTQGHPTVESGMPMMEYVPSVDRWSNYGAFHSPEGMDNFLNIVFKMSEISKIKIDGRGLSSAFGGAMKLIQGTPYAAIRTPIGSGDHYIESTDNTVRWAAWNYGSIDGLQQGRAYGTPISIDLSIPCDDSLDIESTIICGDVNGAAKLLPEKSTCAQFFGFVMEDETNYTLEADMDILTDVKVFPFQLKVIDKKKPAYAKIRVITRSGNWIEREFRYDGIDLAFEPSSINFGTQPFNQQICTTVVVKNLQATTITIDTLRFGVKEFTVTPSFVQLGPNESKQIQICGVVKIPGLLKDSIIAKINCIDLKYLPVEIRGDEPLFYAGDQNWGTLPKNAKVTKQVELINAGKIDVIITDYQPRGDMYFTNTTLLPSLPLTLKAGQRFTYNVDYSPNGEIGVQHKLRIDYKTSADKEKLFSDLQGQGSDAQLSVEPFSWVERVIDTYQQNKGILEYKGKVKISNVGNAITTIKSVTIENGIPTIFDLKGDQTLTDAMAPQDSRIVDVFFKPFEMPQRDAERKYSSEIVVKYIVNGEEKETRSAIEGTALQPMVRITNQDWGSQIVNSVTTLPIEIINKNPYAFAPLTNNEGGTMDLLVDSLVIISQTEPFVWTQTGTKVIKFNPPLSVASLQTQAIFVDFMPKAPGVYRGFYKLYGNTLDTTIATLEGITPGENKIDPIYLLTWIGTTATGNVVGKAAYNTTLQFKEFRGGDYILFSPSTNSSLTPFQVDPSVPFSYEIEFTPDKVTKDGLKLGQNLNGRLPYQDNKFYTQIVFEDGNGKELIGDVFGDGKYLETTLRIIADKNVNVDANANVSFLLEPMPESIDSGNVESARLRVKFDGGLLYPKNLSNKNFPTASLVEEKISNNMLEIDLVTSNQVDGYLGKKEFQSLLYSKNFSNIDGEYYTINKGDKIASPYVVINVIPDVLTVIPVCANVRRIIEFGGSYGIVIKNNVVEVTVGIDAPLTITSVNELGQQTIIFNGFVKKGTYNFLMQSKGLQWLIARQADWVETQGVLVD